MRTCRENCIALVHMTMENYEGLLHKVNYLRANGWKFYDDFAIWDRAK
jgi:hypothetical protein